ncbi:hypothetical protein SERLA73DRAFT_174441 [Serpula lacrymans var. lacrymans S7.3]|uniref:NADH:flavin oxidoreductase/NADH oxidase N-terminal domain-containing protein n=2 Tax=Serpula lacrymans var. lacrymans TaxID=341189 RepID=F8PFZ6_SERL3|nr:uncharacterized protein SERLADRAFT_359217 [Serpula lacrymans var. lacrymans S7.9]EGO05331.1 hypothetical protein SERLA73DRAFT_174441 [Serpula lacrymans var. lacrymans S7.3]EGO31183.1 hypothetical protein SERLADRAFT_359217 [Serpula lacrymans var. lacrymans S7.9]
MPNLNTAAPGVDGYFPLNEPEIGTAYRNTDVFPSNETLPVLFQPLTIKNVTFKNRIFVSAMCQYSSDNGHATDWHLVHLGGFATRGSGAITVEATAVVPEGRLSAQDAGLWEDSQIAPLKRIVNFVHSQGTKIGIQLAHGGRKASTLPPWVYANAAGTYKADTYVIQEDEGGFADKIYGPSEISFADNYPHPKAMTEVEMQRVEDAFIAAIERCKAIGFDFIELHAAHGYLFHNFLSPLSNARADGYGGSLANRLRFPLRVIERAREAWAEKPLFVRISATDWAEGPEMDDSGNWRQWGIEQSKVFVGEMEKLGVDLVDASSGGNWVKQRISLGHGYQVQFGEALKKAYPNLAIGTVGLLVDPVQIESYLKDGKADIVFLARALMRDPHWPMTAAQALGVAVKPANQYERAWPAMLAS